MADWSLDEILLATDGTLIWGHGDKRYRIHTDTRTLEPGDLYLPLVGQTHDGHRFIGQALEKGAAGFLTAQELDLTWPDATIVIEVKNTLDAYWGIARTWRRALNCTVVAITGSSGKTSTKELLASLLSQRWQTAKTFANLNNEFGVPQTLLSLVPGDQVAVVEMGMRHEGEIAALCRVAEPDIGIITHVGTAHLGELGSREAIARAKGELNDYLREHGGTAILFADDPYQRAYANNRAIWVGRSKDADFRLTETWVEDNQQCFTFVDPGGNSREGLIPWLGDHQAMNALMAIAVADFMGMKLPDTVRIEPGRLSGRSEESIWRGAHLINDAYNANPDSMKAALKALSQRSGRRIAVLGDMRELGADSTQMHQDVGKLAADILDALVVVGEAAYPIAEGAEQAGLNVVVRTQDHAHAAKALQSLLKPDDWVLFKASRGAQLEKVIDLLP